MQSIRMVLRKIKAVGNIKKITRAMEMVSAAKLKRVQQKLMAIRPYDEKIRELLESVSGNVRQFGYALLSARAQVNTVALLIIASDKGLCGAYNANILRKATEFLEPFGQNHRLIAIGRRAWEFAQKRNWNTVKRYVRMPTEPDYLLIRSMTGLLTDMFISGEVDEVHIAYTVFINALTFRPTIRKFLPIEPEALGIRSHKLTAQQLTAAERKFPYGYLFEPEPAMILERLIPRFVEISFFRILLESFSSEHAARMNAMRNATENAEQLIEDLTLAYNKARQAGITRELLDIVGGAEALKG
jgi:F-type H+-transporting ATPase subunit gamma